MGSINKLPIDPNKYYIGISGNGGFVKRGLYINDPETITWIKEITKLKFYDIIAHIEEKLKEL